MVIKIGGAIKVIDTELVDHRNFTLKLIIASVRYFLYDGLPWWDLTGGCHHYILSHCLHLHLHFGCLNILSLGLDSSLHHDFGRLLFLFLLPWSLNSLRVDLFLGRLVVMGHPMIPRLLLLLLLLHLHRLLDILVDPKAVFFYNFYWNIMLTVLLTGTCSKGSFDDMLCMFHHFDDLLDFWGSCWFIFLQELEAASCSSIFGWETIRIAAVLTRLLDCTWGRAWAF